MRGVDQCQWFFCRARKRDRRRCRVYRSLHAPHQVARTSVPADAVLLTARHLQRQPTRFEVPRPSEVITGAGARSRGDSSDCTRSASVEIVTRGKSALHSLPWSITSSPTKAIRTSSGMSRTGSQCPSSAMIVRRLGRPALSGIRVEEVPV